jgi:transposase
MENEQREPTQEELKAQIARLNEQVRMLTEQHEKDLQLIDYLKSLNALRAKELFGRKSEQSDASPDGSVQLHLFDDIELEKEIGETEQKVEELRAAKGEAPKRKKSKNLISDPSKFERVEVIQHTPHPDDYVLVGHRIVSEKLKVIPAKYYIEVIKAEVWKKEDEYGTEMVEPESPVPEAGKGLMCDVSVIAYLAKMKTADCLPLYRIEQDLGRRGINLSRQTMSNMLYRGYDVLKPLGEVIKTYVRDADNQRSDETPLTIIEINGNKARAADPSKTSLSYVWLFTAGQGYHPAFWYQVGPGRGASVPLSFFADSKSERRYLMTDGYRDYFGIPGAVNLVCLDHVRRKFVKADTDTVSGHRALAGECVTLLDAVYHEEALINRLLGPIPMDRKDLFEQRRKLREERLKPKLELFVQKIDGLEPKVLPKSNLGRAIAYAESMKPYFPNYFLDGRTEISDAYSERGVKPFVILRKNMLFANTEKGANVTCLYCSLTQTAIHCGLECGRTSGR